MENFPGIALNFKTFTDFYKDLLFNEKHPYTFGRSAPIYFAYCYFIYFVKFSKVSILLLNYFRYKHLILMRCIALV